LQYYCIVDQMTRNMSRTISQHVTDAATELPFQVSNIELPSTTTIGPDNQFFVHDNPLETHVPGRFGLCMWTSCLPQKVLGNATSGTFSRCNGTILATERYIGQ
jgi:hypothetical protein